ncbi:MAG: 50S ribosomal protein L30 [Fimbriimonas sp.]
MLRIELKRSLVGYSWRLGRIAESLGLSRPGKFVYQEDTPSIRGMIFKIKELLEVTEVPDSEAPVKVPRIRKGPKSVDVSEVAVVETSAEPAPKKARKPKAVVEESKE